MPLARATILEYGASRWEPYMKGQINALDHVQKKAGKFANHTNDSDRETLVQRKIARICPLFKAYTERRTWISIVDGLKGPCYLSTDDHDGKIRARKQRTFTGKCFANRTIKLWNRLSAVVLANFSCKLRIFGKEG